MASIKKWGKREFWGVSAEFDPYWVLTKEQEKIRDDLIELCRTVIRPHAIECDREYIYPRKSLNALAEQGLLGLIIPKEFGGMGQNHVCCGMVIETIARYGCGALATVYTMHISSLSTLLFRYHGHEHVMDLFRRVNKDKLVGTLSYSDPATGGHYWYHLSSKTQLLEDGKVKILQYFSWTTSAGFADFYVFGANSPLFKGDYSQACVFLVYPDEVRANTDDWSALGMHANHSGPIVIEAILPQERMLGAMGTGALIEKEGVDTYYIMGCAATYDGMALACIDIAKKHVTRKAHADVGMRICDYPIIQDYFGDCIATTLSSRSLLLMITQRWDQVTNNNDWSLHKDLKFTPRAKHMHILEQAKYVASENVIRVSDIMLKACGGSGFKTDLGLERFLRDARASCVMSPSSEVIKLNAGKMLLLGPDAIDPWDQHCDERRLFHELNKMSVEGKKSLLTKLERDLKYSDGSVVTNHPKQDTDFDNPFNTAPPAALPIITENGNSYEAAISKNLWTKCSFSTKQEFDDQLGLYTFNYPNQKMHSGCLAGHFIQMRVKAEGRFHERFLSPISPPKAFGKIEFLTKFESSGPVYKAFRGFNKSDIVELRGPCGGFEYLPNVFNEVTFLAAGTGVAPALQIIRASMADLHDHTIINMIYYVEKMRNFIFREELDAYQEKCDRLRVNYSVGEAPENWDGEEGFIDTQLIEKYVSKSNKDRKQKIIICGGPTMSVACLHSLNTLQYPSEDIFVYGHFGTQQIRAVYGRYAPLSSHCD